MTSQAPSVDRARIRDDFIRRLFAVAISVGIATTLARMDWITNGTFPNPSEREQLVIMMTGLFATVLSWDGYLASIALKPIKGTLRFTIDIILVFIYMFFLISSKNTQWWLPILTIIFVLYVVWDWLTIREYIWSYDTSLDPSGESESYRAPAKDILRVYWRGFLSRPDTVRGPIITLSWTIYFGALILLNMWNTQYQVYVMTTFAILGLGFYRWDKVIKIGQDHVAGFRMSTRALIIIVLICLDGSYRIL